MTPHARLLVALTLSLTGCRFAANRPAVPGSSVRPGSDVSAQPVASASPGPGSSAAPASNAASQAGVIPVITRIERDLRQLPQDMALSPDGTVWLLASNGIWHRPPGSNTWTVDAPLKTLELPAVPGAAPAELVTDPKGQPWILDPGSGRLWSRVADKQWQVSASGLINAQGLSVGADGTAYAVASDATATVMRIRAGALEPIRNTAWKAPVTTAIEAGGSLLVIDPALKVAHRDGQEQKLAPIPPSLGRLTIGRDPVGAPLIVGGIKAFVAIRVGEKAFTFPTLPVTSLPMTGSDGFTALRLFNPSAGQYLAMARLQTPAGTIGEIRHVTVVGRKPGEVYMPSASYTGTALGLQNRAQREADKLGSGYRLYRLRGVGKTADTSNRTTAWLYDYWSDSDRTLVTLSIAPQGLTTERSYLPGGLAAPPTLPVVAIDSLQAWAAAVKVGLPNHALAEMDLHQENGVTSWWIRWASGEKSYRIDATSGAAVLETSPKPSPSAG
jgi:hypothetical protein